MDKTPGLQGFFGFGTRALTLPLVLRVAFPYQGTVTLLGRYVLFSFCYSVVPFLRMFYREGDPERVCGWSVEG